MLLKRKRSDDQLSPFGSSSPLRVTTAGDATPLDMDVDMDMGMDIDSPLSAMTIRSPTRSCTPSHLPSRTFKRLRNGRPSDHEVHQNTLQMLYRAQQRPQQPQQPQQRQQPQNVLSPPPAANHSTAPSPLSAQSRSPESPSPAQGQRSLHSFWNIPSGQQPAPTPTVSPALGSSVDAIVDQPTTCEDCGVELGGEDAAVDDGYGFETYISSCSLCGKAVCFSCSVSNLGEQRRCLVCAGKEDTRKRWVATTGWPSEPMAVY